jgi:superfamily I DNA/RNA helicase
MPCSSNVALIAAAGSRKTERIIEAALADSSRRVLITTYTNENLRQIVRRIHDRVGVLPSHIDVASWFTLLLNHAIRPYQHALLGEIGVVRGLNFKGQRNRYMTRDKREYYLDRSSHIFRDSASDFACASNAAADGRVIHRLETIYDSIFIDEVQDLVGYDLDFLDLLFRSTISVTVVGDPRQHTLATNHGSKNKKYRGVGFSLWLSERSDYCLVETEDGSYRCNQSICDFASELFPDFPRMKALAEVETGHDGIFEITVVDAHDYFDTHAPVVLRDNRTVNTLGLPAMNFGVAKGSTFDRVLIFPTGPMLKYLKDRDASALKAPERFYVAVTRARHSVAFVI